MAKNLFRSNGFSLLMTAISPHSPCFASFLALPVVFHASSVSLWCHCGLSKLEQLFFVNEMLWRRAFWLCRLTRIFDYVRFSLSLGGNAGDADCEPLQHFSRHSIPVLFLTLHAPPSFRKTPKYVTLPRLPHFAPPLPCTIINNALWMINTFCISIFGIA